MVKKRMHRRPFWNEFDDATCVHLDVTYIYNLHDDERDYFSMDIFYYQSILGLN